MRDSIVVPNLSLEPSNPALLVLSAARSCSARAGRPEGLRYTDNPTGLHGTKRTSGRPPLFERPAIAGWE
jgi:hypothetical protein